MSARHRAPGAIVRQIAMPGFLKRAILITLSFFMGGAVYFAGGAILCFMLILFNSPAPKPDYKLPDFSSKLSDFMNDASSESERFSIGEFNAGVFSIINGASRRAANGGVYAVTTPPEFRIDGDFLVALHQFEMDAVFVRLNLSVKFYYAQDLSISHAYLGDAKIPGFFARKLNHRSFASLGLGKLKRIKISGAFLTLYK